MSTLIGETRSQRLKSEDDLANYFQRFAKSRDAIRVGIEAEFFAVDKVTGQALPYEGKPGIHQILKTLAQEFEYKPIFEGKNIIALERKSSYITLEPGGQIELSAPPVKNVFEIQKQLEKFFNELRQVRLKFPQIDFLAFGIQPFSKMEDIGWVPKKRYAIMADHLKKHGSLSQWMMKCTATNQINFDYLSEENAMANLRTALGITSIVSALFANSSFSEGKPNGFLTKRVEIWNHTDPTRTGILPRFIQPGCKFRDYLNYLLEMPLMFIVRKGKWIPIAELFTFREFIQEGYQGTKATLGDFELHLSTAFPEARLKQYLEVRGVDGQSPDLIPAAAAFWKGILYDPEAREKAWNLVAFASEKERLELQQKVPREGLRAKLGKKPIFEMAEELVNLSCASLAKQKEKDESRNECLFLQKIREQIIYPKKSPAEALLAKWEGEFGYQPARLIEYLSIG